MSALRIILAGRTRIHLLLVLVLLISHLNVAIAASSQSLHIEWGYTPPSQPAVSGYALYQEGVQVCKSSNPKATAMDCQVALTASITRFSLTATFRDGTESPHSTPFLFTRPTNSTGGGTSITEGPAQAVPPVKPAPPLAAAISSSAVTGTAPLAVTFNGSGGGTGDNGNTLLYSWSFGDGASAQGPQVAHTFASGGAYTVELTVTDRSGRTGSARTSLLVRAPVAVNIPPTAVATAHPTTGLAPLTVSFDGSGSTDSDGSIVSSFWTFGDGSTAYGKTARHTYTAPGTYSATLTVTDNKGASRSQTLSLNAQTFRQTHILNIETGEIQVTSDWVRVQFHSAFLNPIVVAGPPTANDNAPCVVRLRNITSAGFDIRLAEWNYLDGKHPAETVSYLVMEKGTCTLPSGEMVQAGSFSGTRSFKTVPFAQPFNSRPIILTSVTSLNGANTISGQIKTIDTAQFSYAFREQERNKASHPNETIHYIAWEPGQGLLGPLRYEVGRTANTLTNQWSTITYRSGLSQPPLLLAGMQTTNETDASALRVRQVGGTGFQVRVEEEQSLDLEVGHMGESVGYLAVTPAEGQ